jgi:hypothetical protein
LEEAMTEATQEPTPSTPATTPTTSKVDLFFDVVTARICRSLSATQDALTHAARWFDARAKVFGNLAEKLKSPPPPVEG